MYERFTDRARKVMQLANQEAHRLNHEYIGTEHILLGLVSEGSGVGANVLKNLGIDLLKVRLEVEKIVLPGPDAVPMTKLPQTPRAKKVIECAIEESRHFNHNYLGTEHLLLGLLKEGVAAVVLMNLGLKLENVRVGVLTLLGQPAVGVEDLPASEFPAEIASILQELDARIKALEQERESAVADLYFETAVHARDQANKLQRERIARLFEWLAKRQVDPSWLSRNDGKVAKLARAIVAEGRWQDLPILADALEEAGCTDAEILSHCRQPGSHAAGCWVVALLLRSP